MDVGKDFTFRPSSPSVDLPGRGGFFRRFTPTFVVESERVAYQVDSPIGDAAADAQRAVDAYDRIGFDLVVVDDEAFPFDAYLKPEDL